MSIVTVGFFCKTGDPVIYKWKKTTFQDSRFSHADYKADWLKTEGNIVIEQEVESTTFDSTALMQLDGVICQDCCACRSCCLNKHFETIKDRRNEIQFGWIRCSTVGEATRDMYADEYNRAVVNGAAPVIIADKELIETEFADGLKVKTESGVWYSLTASEVYPIYRGMHMTTQSLFNIEKEVQELIQTDYDSDMDFDTFKDKDYVTLATDGFDAKLEVKIADATIFAQPITIEQVVM